MLANPFFGDFRKGIKRIRLLSRPRTARRFEYSNFRVSNMWRAFFYACGIMLIILGMECILVGRFMISKESAINRVARKFLGSEVGSAAQSPVGLANGYGSASSSFGPSRFGDNPFSTASNQRSQFNSPFNLAGQRSGAPMVANSKIGRIVHTEDWMPWSLIAAGTIVTLYTHSLRSSYQQQ